MLGAVGDFRGTARFEVRRCLGAGGMGVVYEAFDHERNATVALKTLKRLDAQGIYRFKKEFRALADLDHYNLIRLYELHCEDGLWFFTMELVDGLSFLAYVRPGESDVLSSAADTVIDPPQPGAMAETMDARPGFDERRLRATLVQLARGVAALHEAGKIHRDIKPSNVLVTADGRTVLLDFGLVMDAGGEVATGDHVVGTALYMAPEQAASKPVGPAADWYALGCVLYEALTGRTPFGGAAIDVLMEKQQYEPPPPRQLIPDVPRDLDALCVDLLRFDPKTRPSGQRVLHRLGVREGSSPATAVLSTASFTQTQPFVGRARELAALREAFEQARGGSSVAIFVHGESGIGKSALVRHFVDLQQENARVLVLAGRCYERESVPYKAFDGIIDALSRHMTRLDQVQAALLLPDDAVLLGRVFPVLRRVPAMLHLPLPAHEIHNPQELRRRAFLALRKLLGRLCQRHSVVLLIDDFQWADGDSLVLLADLLQPPESPPFLLVATVRTSETPGIAAIPSLPGDVRQLKVESLTTDESRALVAELGGVAGSDIADEASGHPLFLQELVRYEKTIGSSARDMRLDDALWARITRLEGSAQRLLEVLAVAGAPLPQRVAGSAAGLSADDCGRLVSLLRVAFLARTGSRESDSVEPYHDRVREAVLARLDEETRRRHHRALAVALEAAGTAVADLRLLVRHLEAAGETLRAAQEAERAARIATQALAFDHAAELYRVALRLGSGAAGDVRQLRILLGDSLANAGRGMEAASAYESAAEGATAAEALDLSRRAAQCLLLTGHIEEGLESIQSVLAAVGLNYPKTPQGALASVLLRRLALKVRGRRFRQRDDSTVPARDLARIDVCWHAGLSLAVADHIRGHAFHVKGLLLALRAGEPYRLARALCLEIGYQCTPGGQAEAKVERIISECQPLVKELDHPHVTAFFLGVTGQVHFLSGRFSRALQLCRQSEQMFRERCVGAHWEINTMRLWSARSLLYLGRFRELSGRVPAALLECRQRGDLYGDTSLRSSVSPYVHLADDEPGKAKQDASLALAQWSPSGFHIQHYYALSSEAAAHLYEGDAVAALKRIEHVWAECKRSLLLRIQNVRISLLDLRARSALACAVQHAAGRTELMRRAEKDVRMLMSERMPWSDPTAWLLGAAIASKRGNGEAAVEGLQRALTSFHEAGLAMHAAAARLRLGQTIAGSEGQLLVDAARSWMMTEGIRNPERMAAFLAPGFGPP